MFLREILVQMKRGQMSTLAIPLWGTCPLMLFFMGGQISSGGFCPYTYQYNTFKIMKCASYDIIDSVKNH